jgi:hypothetical protein
MRPWHRSLAVLLMGAAVAGLLVVVTNLSRFDEPLLPEIEALRNQRPVALEGNGYPLAFGFLAAETRDPRAAGVAIIAALQGRRDRGEPITLGKEEMRAILGAPAKDDRLDASLGFKCQARHFLDCADRLVASIASSDLNHPRLALLFSRYETLLQQARFIETPQADLQTPWPPFGPIAALGRLRLAMSFRADSTPVFLEKASQELAFWRTTLREGEKLGTKMAALAAIRNTHDFVSALVRDRDLDSHDVELLRHVVRPFTREESDIGVAFTSEARTFLLSGMPYDTWELSWLTRQLLQPNATFNQQFRETLEPMRLRASLSLREFYERKAYEPLPHELRLGPRMLYNLGGKLALSRASWDPHQFPSRVHDEDGRVELILLQAQIEEQPELDVATIVRTSAHRNPYTGEAMEYDSRARTISFGCLHTAFHPPEPADQCAVALGAKAP